MTEEDYLDVITVGESVEASVVPDKQNEELRMNIEKASAYVETMDEEVEASAVTDQQNEESIGDLQYNTKQKYNNNVEMEKPIEAEVIYEENRGNTEDQDAEASAHTEVPEDQD